MAMADVTTPAWPSRRQGGFMPKCMWGHSPRGTSVFIVVGRPDSRGDPAGLPAAPSAASASTSTSTGVSTSHPGVMRHRKTVFAAHVRKNSGGAGSWTGGGGGAPESVRRRKAGEAGAEWRSRAGERCRGLERMRAGVWDGEEAEEEARGGQRHVSWGVGKMMRFKRKARLTRGVPWWMEARGCRSRVRASTAARDHTRKSPCELAAMILVRVTSMAITVRPSALSSFTVTHGGAGNGLLSLPSSLAGGGSSVFAWAGLPKGEAPSRASC
mmetsp:Transcript_19050/g.48438  ORF Transcript_19050/g.48438 Transcript_19050/m.48438 type:complete len:270 (-) Transcript_19050:553-1362(-)